MPISRLTLLVALVPSALTWHIRSLAAQVRSPSERSQYVRVIAQDYSFEAPSALAAGIVTFHLVNDGADVHQLAVIELGVGHTLKEFFDTMRAKGQPPVWSVLLGMTPTIQPHGEAFFTARLAPGRYILSCLIPAKDGRSHVEKGMSALLTVSVRATPSPIPAKRTVP